MKLILCLFILSTLGATAQIITLSEDFNNGIPSNWSMHNEDGLTPNASVSYVNAAWVSQEDSDSTGIADSCATSTSWYTPTGSSDDWLITPPITVGLFNNYIFWDAKSEDPSFAEDYEVWISTGGNLPADFMDTLNADSAQYSVTFESPFWTRHTVNIDSFAGQTIYIGFRNISNDKFLLMLDNVLITENDPLSIVGPSNSDLTIYPNPAQNVLHFKTTEIELGTSVYIYDMSGRIAAEMPFQPALDISNLPGGVYTVIIPDNYSTWRQVLVVE